MKTITRIVIILAAALAVVGVTYALGQGGSTTQQFRPRFEESRGSDSDDANESRNQEQFRPDQNFEGRGFEGRREFEGGRGGQAFSLRSVAGFGQTLIPMTIVVLLITMLGRVDKWRKRSQKVSASAQS